MGTSPTPPEPGRVFNDLSPGRRGFRPGPAHCGRPPGSPLSSGLAHVTGRRWFLILTFYFNKILSLNAACCPRRLGEREKEVPEPLDLHRVWSFRDHNTQVLQVDQVM